MLKILMVNTFTSPDHSQLSTFYCHIRKQEGMASESCDKHHMHAYREGEIVCGQVKFSRFLSAPDELRL